MEESYDLIVINVQAVRSPTQHPFQQLPVQFILHLDCLYIFLYGIKKSQLKMNIIYDQNWYFVINDPWYTKCPNLTLVRRVQFWYEIIKTSCKSSQRRFSVRRGVLRNLQNSHENTCARFSFLNKVTGWRLQLH